LPVIPNHRLFTAFVNIAILVSFLRHSLMERGEDSDYKFRQEFANAVRIEVMIFYAIAAFHKLNYNFFFAQEGCTGEFYHHITTFFPFLPENTLLYQSFPYFTIAGELGIPLLLLFRHTRNAGILVGLGFHAFLALDVSKCFFNFSATMFAVLSLFLSDSFESRLIQRLNSFYGYLGEELCPQTIRLLRMCRLAFVITLLACLGMSLWGKYYKVLTVLYISRQSLWWVFSTLVMWLFITTEAQYFTKARNETFLARPPLGQALLVILLVLNGLSPYLGVKSGGSFDMYSNLQIGIGRQTNHFLIPQSLDLFGWLGDLVLIRDSSDPVLRARFIAPLIMPTYFELRRYTAEHPNISLTFVRHGVEYHVARVENDPELATPPPLVLAKLLWFRGVNIDGKSRCEW
jgi:hypothetical protein